MRAVRGINVGGNNEFIPTTIELHLAALSTSPLPDSPDTSLVAEARAGNTGAFGVLYARYSRLVHGILLARVPPSEVDDLVHDVFLRAFARLDDLRDASRFGPWLGTIARNLSNDFHRQSRPRLEVSQNFAEVEIEDRAADSLDDADAVAALEAIRGLPESYRETLLLRLVEGMTGPEIASRTGLSHGSVRVNLHRGMQMLREKLGERAGPRRAKQFRSRQEK
ncbi:MAG TPA: sigma-70 family RNA polymerase sigma factor [Candidatus Acidoferrales bacterium]